jgi:Mn2+/Fe2+ NRAMP family transporter
LDVRLGTLFFDLVMCAIIGPIACTLRPYGHHDLDGVADAAMALEPAAGGWVGALFALGVIGSGMPALPVLAGSGLAGLGKRSGLSRRAQVFYGTVVLGIISGAAVGLIRVDPVQFFVISAVSNGVTAAAFLALVMLVSGNRNLMGDHVKCPPSLDPRLKQIADHPVGRRGDGPTA